jgi:D-alanine-D-alanine ligase
MNKTIGLFFGGKSVEHEVSIRSACNVYHALDKDKYNVVCIYIDKENLWHVTKSPKDIKSYRKNVVAIISGSRGQICDVKNNKEIVKIDVAFPIVHGSIGEDGTLQGIFNVANVAYVGCDIKSSAIGLDKALTKQLLLDNDIKTANFIYATCKDVPKWNKVVRKLGISVYVKPNNLGSSVGVSVAKNEEEFKKAFKKALKFDNEVIIEEAVSGREIEFAVIGNEDIVISPAGEIKVKNGFYDYDTKYVSENNAVLIAPAEVKNLKKIQKIIAKTYKVLKCSGMARIDGFLKDNGEFLVNEINTVPGFTNISMYPKLMELSGYKYPNLLDKLISLAIERYNENNKLKYYYEK